MLPNNECRRIKSCVVSTLNETLTSDHLTDKCPVLPEAINHADCNAPPANQISHTHNVYTKRTWLTTNPFQDGENKKISEKYDEV